MSESILSETKAIVSVYRLERSSVTLYPLGEGGRISEFTEDAPPLVRTLYRWLIRDDLRSVLSDEESKDFDSLFVKRFSPAEDEGARTPAILLKSVSEMRGKIQSTVWTQIEEGSHYVPLAYAFLNHLELVAGTYIGYSDVFVVFQ